MSTFTSKLERVLTTISEGVRHTLYKGINTESGYERYPHQAGATGIAIPGFLSNYHIGRVYSEPLLVGSADSPALIIAVKIDQDEVEDKTDEFMDWCDDHGKQDYDISMGFPKEWRNGSIWTVGCGGSGHAGVSCYNDIEFVYCGVQKPFIVVKHYNNQDEWDTDSEWLY